MRHKRWEIAILYSFNLHRCQKLWIEFLSDLITVHLNTSRILKFLKIDYKSSFSQKHNFLRLEELLVESTKFLFAWPQYFFIMRKKKFRLVKFCWIDKKFDLSN